MNHSANYREYTYIFLHNMQLLVTPQGAVDDLGKLVMLVELFLVS